MFEVKKWHLGAATFGFAVCLLGQQAAVASPFGVGVFGEDVPFGSETSISIGLSNNVDTNPTPSGGNLFGTGSHTVTVTSTDVVGYDLYVNATSSTAMSNGGSTIAASANATPSALALNSWGYNTTGSTSNFIGMTGTQALLNSGTGPFKNGVATTVTYGTYIDTSKASGVYSVGVTYTAVGRT